MKSNKNNNDAELRGDIDAHSDEDALKCDARRWRYWSKEEDLRLCKITRAEN